MSIVFTILKIIGIILLIILCIFLLLLLLALFVPIRYKIEIHRKTDDTVSVRALVRLSWLLHLLTLSYTYPDEAYVCCRFLGITIFRSDSESVSSKGKNRKNKESENIKESMKENGNDNINENNTSKTDAETKERSTANEKNSKIINEKSKKSKKDKSIWDYLKRVWNAIKNIQYTIRKICDKIKHIVKNIRYYIRILQSELFENTWGLCSKQAIELIKHIKPRKVKGMITVGTGDPASTGQVCAIFGILYPFIGNGIIINPDFEQAIFEGDLLIKGRVTALKLIRTGAIIYFNKDLKKLIHLFNTGGSVNGR